jgi:hypothetical protein
MTLTKDPPWPSVELNLPAIRDRAAVALAESYISVEEASTGIESKVRQYYGDDPSVGVAVSELGRLYRSSFPHTMKSDWQVYPDNIGHKDWPG